MIRKVSREVTLGKPAESDLVHSRFLLCVAAAWVVLATPSAARAQSAVGDSAYASNHARLLFWPYELPAVRQKVRDGGEDDAAYAFIRSQYENVYRYVSVDSILDIDYGMEQITNLGLAGLLEEPVDSAALALGRQVTLYISQNYGVDTDAYGSALRLRSLALGYDMCFATATPAERSTIVDEATLYLQYMMNNGNYDIWRYSPYTSNKTAMVAAAMGLGAIAFSKEIDPGIVSAALAKTTVFFDAWEQAQLDDGGAYGEGALYGLWSLRHLIYYFEARRRYDSFDYSSLAAIRNVERWLVYEMDPRGNGSLNNIQDCTDFHRPLARHTTYLDWAQSRWGSGLAAYIWRYAAGIYGYDHMDEADKAGTALWNLGIAPVNPSVVVAPSAVWEQRGLYYYRSSWPDGPVGDDVVFSFYSGEFRGGHAQEDQNQFTLSAFGNKFVSDHGAGYPAKVSAAHNLVLIDDAGQHNAGASIGTDGRIVEWIIGGYGDYLVGDAAAAYATYSPYNAFGVPYPWSNWSWGYAGANPVNRALRTILSVHGPSTPPFFVVVDDIEKDGSAHAYDWSLHTDESNTVDVQADRVRITGTGAEMQVYALNPPLSTLSTSVNYFDNGSEDPNSWVTRFRGTAVNPNFAFLLIPLRSTMASPLVVTSPTSFGTMTAIIWGNGEIDIVLLRLNPEAALITFGQDDLPSLSLNTAANVLTDAKVAAIRISGSSMTSYLLADMTTFLYNDVPWVTFIDSAASVGFDGGRVQIGREDANFSIRADGVNDVYYRRDRIPVVPSGDYLFPAVIASVDGPPSAPLSLRAYPNPMQPDVRVEFTTDRPGRVRADIYDVRGRLVRRALDAHVDAGLHALSWDARDDSGARVSSGVYFVRVAVGDASRTMKVTVTR